MRSAVSEVETPKMARRSICSPSGAAVMPRELAILLAIACGDGAALGAGGWAGAGSGRSGFDAGRKSLAGALNGSALGSDSESPKKADVLKWCDSAAAGGLPGIKGAVETRALAAGLGSGGRAKS